MKEEILENLAFTCQNIINDPHTHIPTIQPFLKNRDDITLLALYKVFSNIVPLYKIKIKEDKIQHKKEYIKLQTFEQNLYHYYRAYVKLINNLDTVTSYKIAVSLLQLDHFNFTDVIIEKVFRGCNKEEVKDICVNALNHKLANDNVGEVTFKIILCMLEFKWSDEVYKGIVNVNIINKLTIDDIKPVKEEKQKEVILANEKKKEKNNRKNKYKGNSRSKADKKSDKEMAKIERELKIKKEKETEKETKKMLAKIVDNLMRIFFIILDEKKTDLYEYCYLGLINYKRFIAFEFKEGLYMYLGINVLEGKHNVRLTCIRAILSIYGNESFEFKPLLLSLFELLTPLKYNYNNEQTDLLIDFLRTMLIEKRQSTKTVSSFVVRLMQLLSLRSNERLRILTNRILSNYKIDVHDYEIVRDAVYNVDNDDYESNGLLPFYCGSILNKIY